MGSISVAAEVLYLKNIVSTEDLADETGCEAKR